MAKVRIDVTKLENPTAEFISLVTRGANRSGFKIVKSHPSERTMIDIGRKLDLADLAAVLKSADKGNPEQSKGAAVVEDNKAPAKTTDTVDKSDVKLAGLIVVKGDWLTDEVKKSLSGLGLDMDNPVENEDGTLLYQHADFDGDVDDMVVAKMSGETLAIVEGLDVDAVLKGTTFEEAYDDLGFLPSVNEMLVTTATEVKKALCESTVETLDTVRKSNTEATDAATAYAKAMQDSLPTAAFKADEIISAAVAAAGPGDDEGEGNDDDLSKGQKAKTVEKDEVACPACEAKHTECNMCTGGKVTKAEAESISKLVKKADKKEVKEPTDEEKMEAAAHNAGAHEKAAQHIKDAAGIPPDGVDAAAWKAMSQEERSFVKGSITKEEPVQKADSAILVAIQKGLTDLTTAIGTLSKVQQSQGTELAALQGKVTKVLKGTTIGGVPADDRPDDDEQDAARKGEGELGLIDTAFNTGARRVRKGSLSSLLEERSQRGSRR